jgi:ATP synthase, Delta/Epsilon chain, beta-sandwich domain
MVHVRQAIYKNTEVHQVNLAATSGDMGVLANHVPTIEQLKAGVIEVLENASTTKKFFGKCCLYEPYWKEMVFGERVKTWCVGQ